MTHPVIKTSRSRGLQVWSQNHPLVPLLLIMISVGYYLSYANRFINLVDEGLVVNGALRVLSGQIPIVDFYSYAPGRYWLLAAFFKLFGVSLSSERAMWIALMTLRNLLAFYVARELMPAGVAFGASLAIALLPGPWFKTFYPLALFLHLAALAYYLNCRSRRSALVLGLTCGVILVFRLQFGLTAVVITSAIFIAAPVLGFRFRDPTVPERQPAGRDHHLHELALTGAGFLAIALPLLIYLFAQPGRGLTFERVTSTPFRASTSYFEYVAELNPDDQPANTDQERAFARLIRSWLLPFYLVSLALGVLLIGFHIRQNTTFQQTDTNKLLLTPALLLWSLAMFLRYMPDTSVRTFLITGQAALILTLSFVMRFGFPVQQSGDPPARTGSIQLPQPVKALAYLVGIYVVLTWAGLSYYALRDCTDCGTWARPPVDPAHVPWPHARLNLEQPEAERLLGLVAAITTRSLETDPIFTYRHSMIYFLANRQNATTLDNMVAPRVSAREAAIIKTQFEHRPPEVQVFQVSKATPLVDLLAGYPCDLRMAMMDGYAYAEMVGNYLIMVREPGASGWEALRTAHQRRGIAFDIADYTCGR